MQKKLDDLLKLRDQTIKLIDTMVGNDDIKIAYEHYRILTELIEEQLYGYMPVIATEACEIIPGASKEIKTNIDEIEINSNDENKMLEFTQEGFISTYSPLSLQLLKDYEKGNKVKVISSVPSWVYWQNIRNPKYKDHYCNKTSTLRYSIPGVYKIESGQIIGITGIDPEVLNVNNPFLKEENLARSKKLYQANKYRYL